MSGIEDKPRYGTALTEEELVNIANDIDEQLAKHERVSAEAFRIQLLDLMMRYKMGMLP